MKRNVKLKPKNPLSLEERERLAELDTADLRILLKDMEVLVQDQERALLTHSYRPGRDEELKWLKTKAQGAREFYMAYMRRLEDYKNRQLPK